MTAVNGLQIEGLGHHFDGARVLEDLSLIIAPGEIVALLGPSGSGKSTCLRLIAGLEAVSQGAITIDGRLVAAPGHFTPPEKRRVGLVLQDYALFPHLSAADNVSFGLPRRMPRAERRARALDLLGEVELEGFADAFPHTLSGGQQQRVALARALAPEPDLLLMDEPFSGLDQMMREAIGERSVASIRQRHVPALVVTHDPAEAFQLADRIAVLQEGRIVQVGTAEALFAAPANAYIMALFGQPNRLPALVLHGHAETPLGRVAAPHHRNGERVIFCFHASAVELAPEGASALVSDIRRIGPVCRVKLRLEDGSEVRLDHSGRLNVSLSERVHVRLDLGAVRLLADQGETIGAVDAPSAEAAIAAQ